MNEKVHEIIMLNVNFFGGYVNSFNVLYFSYPAQKDLSSAGERILHLPNIPNWLKFIYWHFWFMLAINTYEIETSALIYNLFLSF